MSLLSEDEITNPFEAWGEMHPDDWRDAIGILAEMNYTRNAEMRAVVEKFAAAHPEVDLDHLQLIYAAVNYAAVLGFSLARTESSRVDDLSGWVERAWAYGSFDTPIDEINETESRS